MSKASRRYILNEWNPENPKFWRSKGRRKANRNLWLSISTLLLAFVAIWQVCSAAVAQLLRAGFHYMRQLSFSGLQPCRAFPAPRCAFSIPSWCRFSEGGAGHRLGGTES